MSKIKTRNGFVGISGVKKLLSKWLDTTCSLYKHNIGYDEYYFWINDSKLYQAIYCGDYLQRYGE